MEYQGEENLNVMKLAENYNKWLVDMICSAAQGRNALLDFGSGDGFFAKSVSLKMNKEVCCVEPAENLYKYYEKMPYKSLAECANSSVDFIYSLNVLEHIEDDAAIVNDFYRVLSKEGSIFLFLPAFSCLWSSMDDLVGHYRRYGKKDVLRLFDAKKWKVEQVRYADFCGWFVTMLFKFVGSKSGKINAKQLKIYDKFIFPLSVLGDKITGGQLMGKNIIIKVTKQ